MGYVYRGQALVCDKCSSTGAVLRLCPYWVTEPGGQRLRYCSPNALCDGCLAEIGSAVLHAACKQGAADSQAQNDARVSRLAAGEMFVSGALSGASWYVPAGLVGAEFRGSGGAHTWRLIPSADYGREYRAKGLMLALSDFPGAEVWEDNPDVRKAREAGRVHAYWVAPIRACEVQFEAFEVHAPDFGSASRAAREQLGHEHYSVVRSDTLAGAR